MIPITRKNLTCLLSNDAYRRSISCTLHLCLFSTSKPAIVDSLLRKYELSPQSASKLAPVFNRAKDSGEPDSILLFLKENGFLNAQSEAILKYSAGYTGVGRLKDNLKPKIRALQALGLPPDEIAKVISSNRSILCVKQNNRLVTSVSILKELLGTSEAVANLCKRSPWILDHDLDRTMVPNIEFLKSCGVPMERIFKFLYNWPRNFLVKPHVIRKSVEKVEQMGVDRSSKMFIHAMYVVSGSSSETLELKFQAFKNLGFSESDTIRTFQVQPHLFTRSAKQIERAKDIILATGKYDLFCIIKCPRSLGCSIEKKFKPRFRILKILESKSLIKKWPALTTVCTMTDKRFFDKFVDPYSSEVGEAKNFVSTSLENRLESWDE